MERGDDGGGAGAARQARALAMALGASAEGGRVARLALALAATLVANAALQIALNAWQGAFYDALARRDVGGFLAQLGVFLGLAAGLSGLNVAQTWSQRTLEVRLRDWLTDDLTARWLAPGRAWRLGVSGAVGAHPDQRMHEDARKLAELTADLSAGLFQATLLLASFAGVLWLLSSRVALPIGAASVSVPGYLLWCALAFAAGGSLLAWRVGRPLVPLNGERYGREAALRYELVRVADSAEGVALYRGEADERRRVGAALAEATRAAQRIADRLARLTWVTAGYGWLGLVAPIVVAAPGYFGGGLSFGELMMAVGAFGQVQLALRWFVDNTSRIAEWRAALGRVADLRDALDAMTDDGAAPGRLRLSRHPGGRLGWRGLAVALPAGRVAFEDGDGEIAPGETALILGEPLAGKSTLFRALAGLWPQGEGELLLPPPETILFLPDRPYLPPGTLRAALAYPDPPGRFDTAAAAAALRRLGLGHLVAALDRAARWDETLALDEQQRLAFARALLRRPGWVIADDAMAALSTAQRGETFAALRETLPQAAVILFARAPVEPCRFDRVFRLRRSPDGGAPAAAAPGRAAAPV